MRAPAGRFTFTGAEAGSIVLIAGGVGITPLMSKIRYLTDLSWPGDIYLVFSVKTERDIIFRDELDALRRRHPNLHVTVTLTRDDGAAWSGERGRITPALLTRAVPEIATRRVHICGPTEMTDPTRQMLSRPGRARRGDPGGVVRVAQPGRRWPTRLVPAAPRGTSSEPRTTLNGDGATITFARSRKDGLARGPNSARGRGGPAGSPSTTTAGPASAGSARTRLLAGRVVMDAEDALDPVDRANNVILSCQARCVDQVVVDA